MTGLLNALTPEEQRRVQQGATTQGLLAAAAGALAPTRGNGGAAIANALLGGMGAFNQQFNQAGKLAATNAGILGQRQANKTAADRNEIARQRNTIADKQFNLGAVETDPQGVRQQQVLDAQGKPTGRYVAVSGSPLDPLAMMMAGGGGMGGLLNGGPAGGGPNNPAALAALYGTQQQPPAAGGATGVAAGPGGQDPYGLAGLTEPTLRGRMGRAKDGLEKDAIRIRLRQIEQERQRKPAAAPGLIGP